MMPGFDLIHWSSHLMTRSIGSSAILLDCIYHIQRQRTANYEIFSHPLCSNWFKCCPFNWPHIVDDLILYCKWSDIIGLPGCNASIIQENMHHTEFANTTLPLPALLHHWTKKHKDFDHQWVTDNAPTLKSCPLLWRDWIKCHHPTSPPHHPPLNLWSRFLQLDNLPPGIVEKNGSIQSASSTVHHLNRTTINASTITTGRWINFFIFDFFRLPICFERNTPSFVHQNLVWILFFLTRQHIGAVDDYGENNNDDDNDYGDDGIDEHNDDLYIIGRFTKNHPFLEQVCLSVCNVFPHFLKSRK